MWLIRFDVGDRASAPVDFLESGTAVGEISDPQLQPGVAKVTDDWEGAICHQLKLLRLMNTCVAVLAASGKYGAGGSTLPWREVVTGGLAATVCRLWSMCLISGDEGRSVPAWNASMSPGTRIVCPNTSSAGEASISG